jgi:hypothetical protein
MHQLQFLVLVVYDFQEKHPTELGYPLRVAIDSNVLAHDVLNRFYGISNRHIESGNLSVESSLEFADSLFEAGASAKWFDEFNGGTHPIEWSHFKDLKIVET